ncbi:hypothetical protein SRHO_G00022420 [Serrasalmus rhombeus]
MTNIYILPGQEASVPFTSLSPSSPSTQDVKPSEVCVPCAIAAPATPPHTDFGKRSRGERFHLALSNAQVSAQLATRGRHPARQPV